MSTSSTPISSGTAAGSDEGSRSQICRRFGLPLLIPGLLQGKSGSLVTPMLPIFVMENLHGTASQVTVLASAYAVAAIVSSPIVGGLLGRCNIFTSRCLALSILVATAIGSFFTHTFAVLLVLRFVGGVGVCVWDLTQKIYMSREVPGAIRGRVAGMQAGWAKIMMMVAAVLGGFIAQNVSTRGIFIMQAFFSLVSLLTVVIPKIFEKPEEEQAEDSQLAHDEEQAQAGAGSSTSSRKSPTGRQSSKEAPPPLGMRKVLRMNWRSLFFAGTYCSVLDGYRRTWSVSLPLQAVAIGYSKQGVGFSVALQRCIEATMSLTVAGHIADTYGRRVIGLPSFGLMGLGFFVLSQSDGSMTMILATVLFAVGNGLSGGLSNAMLADVAPAQGREGFVGLWKTYNSVGPVLLPLLFGFLSDATGSLGLAGITMSFVGWAMIPWLFLLVPVEKRFQMEALPAGASEALLSQEKNKDSVAPGLGSLSQNSRVASPTTASQA